VPEKSRGAETRPERGTRYARERGNAGCACDGLRPEKAASLGDFGETLRFFMQLRCCWPACAGLMCGFATAFVPLRGCGSAGREPAPDCNSG